MIPMPQLAKSAIDVQNACNLSGVAHSLVELCQELRDNGVESSTDAINQHPLVRLYVSKLVALSMPGCELRLPFEDEYAFAKKLAA
jgi:hypothetical protein